MKPFALANAQAFEELRLLWHVLGYSEQWFRRVLRQKRRAAGLK